MRYEDVVRIEVSQQGVAGTRETALQLISKLTSGLAVDGYYLESQTCEMTQRRHGGDVETANVIQVWQRVRKD